MSETYEQEARVIDIDEVFSDIVQPLEQERLAAEKNFVKDLEVIDSSNDSKNEKALNTVTMGKAYGIQDLAGGGFRTT